MRSTALLATLALALSTTSGCYLGRTKSAKTSAYVLNGMMLTVGGAVAASGSKESMVPLGGMLLAGGALIAIAATTMATTEVDPAPEPLEHEGMRSTVTAPGLTPAIVQIR